MNHYWPSVRSALSASVSFAAGLFAYSGWIAWEARSVWLAHWLAGSALAVTALAIGQVVTGRDARGILPVLLLGQGVGALPDALVRFGVAHTDWMDVFAFHMRLDTETLPLLLSLAALLASIGLFLGSAHLNDRRRARK